MTYQLFLSFHGLDTYHICFIANFSSYETVRHERVTSCIIYLWGIKFVLKILVNFLTIFINFLTISQTTLSFFIISSTLPVLNERNQCSAANSIVPYCFIYNLRQQYLLKQWPWSLTILLHVSQKCCIDFFLYPLGHFLHGYVKIEYPKPSIFSKPCYKKPSTFSQVSNPNRGHV